MRLWCLALSQHRGSVTTMIALRQNHCRSCTTPLILLLYRTFPPLSFIFSHSPITPGLRCCASCLYSSHLPRTLPSFWMATTKQRPFLWLLIARVSSGVSCAQFFDVACAVLAIALGIVGAVFSDTWLFKPACNCFALFVFSLFASVLAKSSDLSRVDCFCIDLQVKSMAA